MSKLIEQSYTNSIGQLIRPGDRVLCIISGHGSYTAIREGVFAGTVNDHPSAHVVVNEWSYFDKHGNVIGYVKAKELGIGISRGSVKRRSTLPAGRVYKLA